MKLSKKLVEILELMNNGYELGCTDEIQGYRWWLQKGGLGKGGDSVHLHRRVKVSKLRELGFIENDGKHHFPTTPYFLTEKGLVF